MADFAERVQRIERFRRVERVILDRTNPLEVLTPSEVFQRYRFMPASILLLVDLMYPNLTFPTTRSSPLPPLLATLVALQFYASGTHHLLVADLHRISRATVCRVVRKVTDALVNLRHRYICFPRGRRLRKVQQDFYNIAGFPKVIGCIDGTQIKIQAPHQNEGDFVNRKGFHSINVQMVCDAEFRITNCVAKWPGSVHDSRIFRESDLCLRLENGIDGLLLGDSGYPCKPYLMTPYGNPLGRAQERFNIALCKTRVVVEQTFGVLKRRFPCLKYGLRIEPVWACKTTVACAVLHNFGIENGDIFGREPEEAAIEPDIQVVHGDDNVTGARFRDNLAVAYFS